MRLPVAQERIADELALPADVERTAAAGRSGTGRDTFEAASLRRQQLRAQAAELHLIGRLVIGMCLEAVALEPLRKE